MFRKSKILTNKMKQNVTNIFLSLLYDIRAGI